MMLVKKARFDGITGYQLGWSLFGPPLMTVYFYVFDDIMIDTAQSNMHKQVMGIAGQHKLNRIYLTHYHEDHSGNAAAIKKAYCTTVYGSKTTGKKLSSLFRILPYQRYIWGKATPLQLEVVPDAIETKLGEMTPVNTPGHSKDHLAYHLRDCGVLFSGDLYLSERIKYFRSDEDIRLQIASLKKLVALDFDVLLCSHRPKIKNGKKYIQNKLAFLEDLYGSIVHLWEKGLTENQIFKTLKLKENHFVKIFCFGNVSMINSVRSAVRSCEKEKSGLWNTVRDN